MDQVFLDRKRRVEGERVRAEEWGLWRVGCSAEVSGIRAHLSVLGVRQKHQGRVWCSSEGACLVLRLWAILVV